MAVVTILKVSIWQYQHWGREFSKSEGRISSHEVKGGSVPRVMSVDSVEGWPITYLGT